MSRFKKSLALVLTAAIVVAAFPGCSSDDGGTNI